MTPKMKISLAALTVAVAFAADASAETLYKLIDRSGKVTYSESKPKTFDGQVIRIDIDPNANTATLEKPQPKSMGEGTVNRGEARTPSQIDDEARVAQARERLERAQKALQDAKDNPQDGDMMMVGKVGGGVRHIPSDAYQQRLDRLAAEVGKAQDELKRAQQGR